VYKIPLLRGTPIKDKTERRALDESGCDKRAFDSRVTFLRGCFGKRLVV